ncbi:EAL domain-containing protein [Massilia aerilata]|uniref:EAL domain-containing protein n=1 Tax=Massilia aerilata TaxID=453817 RepID=A0ABW0RYP8_9BURK
MPTITEAELVQGLQDHEFILYYQPKASLITNRVVGAEALARWRRRDGGVVAPGVFIPLMQEAGLLRQLTRQLLARLMHDMEGALGADIRVSFNVGVDDFEDDALSGMLLDAIGSHRLLASSLELEVTETQALQCCDILLGRIQGLLDAGISLAMDDFGTGYSSIDTLSKLPFTTIKLDQGIVGRMLGSAKDAAIVRTAIRLGHEMGVEVVAEGVETQAQRDVLIECGCKLVQGYLVSPPLPLEAFRTFRAASGDAHSFPVGLVHLAILDHVQWRRQIVSYAVQRATLPRNCPTRKADGYPEMNVTLCALGRWYFGDGRHLEATPIYHAIDAPHREVHRIGEAIVAQVRQGATLAELAGLLSTMKAVSTTLVRLLEDLEDAGLQELYREAEIEAGPVTNNSL